MYIVNFLNIPYIAFFYKSEYEIFINPIHLLQKKRKYKAEQASKYHNILSLKVLRILGAAFFHSCRMSSQNTFSLREQCNLV